MRFKWICRNTAIILGIGTFVVVTRGFISVIEKSPPNIDSSDYLLVALFCGIVISILNKLGEEDEMEEIEEAVNSAEERNNGQDSGKKQTLS